MKETNGFVEYIKELLEPFDDIKYRAMFGGYGLFKNGVMFGLIANNELYFKADKLTAEFFKSNGSTPFTYEKETGRAVSMSYFLVLEEVLEDEKTLEEWLKKAYDAAIEMKTEKASKK